MSSRRRSTAGVPSARGIGARDSAYTHAHGSRGLPEQRLAVPQRTDGRLLVADRLSASQTQDQDLDCTEATAYLERIRAVFSSGIMVRASGFAPVASSINLNPKCQPVPVQVRQDARAVRAPPLNRHPLRRRAQACFIDVAVGLRADATRATHRRRPRRRRRRPCRRRPCRRRPRYPFRPCRPLAALATGGVARRRALKSGLCLRRCCTA